MLLLKGNLPIFSLLNFNIRLFIYVRRHDCVIEYGWFIRVFLYILINYLSPNKKKYLKSKIYGKFSSIKLMILLFRLYLCSYSMYFLVWYYLFDEFCYINTDCRLLKLLIIVKFTIKIHMSLEKYIKITVFLLNMKYLRNI